MQLGRVEHDRLAAQPENQHLCQFHRFQLKIQPVPAAGGVCVQHLKAPRYQGLNKPQPIRVHLQGKGIFRQGIAKRLRAGLPESHQVIVFFAMKAGFEQPDGVEARDAVQPHLLAGFAIMYQMLAFATRLSGSNVRSATSPL